MSADQPAQPPLGLLLWFPPLSGSRPTPLFFPFGLPPPGRDSLRLTENQWGRALVPAATPFPAPSRGRPWTGSAPTTGGTPAPAGSPGPVSVPDAPHPGGTRPSVSPTHGSLLLPGGGTPTSHFPHRSETLVLSGGNATVPVPHRTGTAAHRGGILALLAPTSGHPSLHAELRPRLALHAPNFNPTHETPGNTAGSPQDGRSGAGWSSFHFGPLPALNATREAPDAMGGFSGNATNPARRSPRLHSLRLRFFQAFPIPYPQRFSTTTPASVPDPGSAPVPPLASWQSGQAFRENPRKTTHFDTPCQPSQKGDIFQGQNPVRGRHPPRTGGREDRPLFPRRSATSPDAARGAALSNRNNDQSTPRLDLAFSYFRVRGVKRGEFSRSASLLPVRPTGEFSAKRDRPSTDRFKWTTEPVRETRPETRSSAPRRHGTGEGVLRYSSNPKTRPGAVLELSEGIRETRQEGPGAS